MGRSKTSRRRGAARPISAGSSERTKAGLVCVFLVVIVCIVFGQTIRHEFINYDDNTYITENAHVLGGLTWQNVTWAFGTGRTGYAHPITWLSHQFDSQLFGTWAGGHHLTSLILHAVNAVLLFLFFWRTTRKLWPSAFVAALFAIHPLHVESVAWVAERKDVLSGLFFFLTLHAYAAYAAKPQANRYLLTLVLFGFGILSKPMLVTVPFLLLLLDYWPLQRISNQKSKLGRLLLEKIPFVIIAVVWSVITFILQGKYGAVAETKLGIGLRTANAIVSYVTYLGSTLWPHDLGVFYPYPRTLPVVTVFVSAALLVLLSILCIARRKVSPYLVVGWLWYLGMLVPVIGLIQVGEQARADRYTYLPQIGFCLAATWGILELSRQWRHRREILMVAALFVIAVFVVLAFIQTSYWQNNQTLWSHSLATSSGNYVAENNLGNDLAHKGRLDEAVVHFRKSLEISPNYPEANNNLGSVLASEKRWEEATGFYEAALHVRPHDAKTRSNIGLSLTEIGRLDEASIHFREALRIDPGLAEAHYNFARLLLMSGQRDEAVAELKQVLRLQPNNATIKAQLQQLSVER